MPITCTLQMHYDTLKTCLLVVAMLGKPQASYQVVNNNHCKKACIKLEYVGRPVYMIKIIWH